MAIRPTFTVEERDREYPDYSRDIASFTGKTKKDKAVALLKALEDCDDTKWPTSYHYVIKEHKNWHR